MVGKILRRRRLHQPAPKPTQPQQSGGEEVFSAAVLTFSANTGKGKGVLTSDIFSGVNIDPKILVKKLDTDSRNPVSVIKDEDEKVMSKKEKMKMRKERWLQKIESIKLAKQQHKAEAKRKATPVVGDMHPLMNALPELSDLVTVSKFCKQRNTVQKKKKVLTNFNQMKSAQKRKVLEEEMAQFHKTISNPLFKANPLSIISQHLSKRLKQENEEEPL
ncbi:PREDICTED: protein FAM207A [Thamnophis sirtalis]|uniref:Protein FAM207A n=1 Tax=Thamnophis sirtalis TaxID=35019 RepID=A0A6I9YTH1_9SAUR|nr:PREDICTED: protein FAM207A [Thamnophis sirtalis]